MSSSSTARPTVMVRISCSVSAMTMPSGGGPSFSFASPKTSSSTLSGSLSTMLRATSRAAFSVFSGDRPLGPIW